MWIFHLSIEKTRTVLTTTVGFNDVGKCAVVCNVLRLPFATKLQYGFKLPIHWAGWESGIPKVWRYAQIQVVLHTPNPNFRYFTLPTPDPTFGPGPRGLTPALRLASKKRRHNIDHLCHDIIIDGKIWDSCVFVSTLNYLPARFFNLLDSGTLAHIKNGVKIQE